MWRSRRSEKNTSRRSPERLALRGARKALAERELHMVTGIIGRKVGMTQIFDADGTVHPATVIKAGPCVVVQSKTAPTDGYEAVQLGLVEETPPKANKPTTGHFKKANVPATRVRREVKLVSGGDPPTAGDQVLCSIFNNGERVDVVGTGRGKGFQGVVKRQ